MAEKHRKLEVGGECICELYSPWERTHCLPNTNHWFVNKIIIIILMALVKPLAEIFSAKCMQSKSCNLAIKIVIFWRHWQKE